MKNKVLSLFLLFFWLAPTIIVGREVTLSMASPNFNTPQLSLESPLIFHINGVSVHSVGGPVKIDFTLSNESSEDIWFLTWYTPFEGIWGDIFIIECANQHIDYIGPMAKRGSPGSDNFTLIPAGSSLQTQVDLSTAYALPRQGGCRVTFNGFLHHTVKIPTDTHPSQKSSLLAFELERHKQEAPPAMRITGNTFAFVIE